MRKRSHERPTRHHSGVRCAVYTRKSSEEGLEQGFNSLDAQFRGSAALGGAALHVLPTEHVAGANLQAATPFVGCLSRQAETTILGGR